MRYCERCILPDTRPGIEIGGDGICSACAAHRAVKDAIDWDARRRAFAELVERIRNRDCRYDCVIPVSGGKDSTWQTSICLEHGLRPLAVTWRPPARTELGARNLRNLVELGVDHIDFSVNPRVEREFLLRSLTEYGTTAIPMHLAIFNIPLTVAARFDIPLVVWGENSALEYAGSGPEAHSHRLDSAWVAKYGAVHGTTASDFVSEGLSETDLTPYLGPGDSELAAKGIDAVFLGYFFRWDPAHTYDVARAKGFEADSGGARTGYYEYADIDDDFIAIHHWLKWFKFGFTRTYDNLSLEIRNGRLTREQAIEIVRARGDETPHGDIRAFCEYVGIEEDAFFEIAERFRNDAIWVRRDGVWEIDGFLIEDWPWASVATSRA